MSDFFPRHTVEWAARETVMLRRLSLSIVTMALITGLVLRAYRWFLLTATATEPWLFVAGYGAAAVLLVTMATLHLSNYPVSHWLWRAPLFAVLTGLTEGVVSAGLIAMRVERSGTDVAHWHDWPGLVTRAVILDTVLVVTFAAVLAAIVQLVRTRMLRRERQGR